MVIDITLDENKNITANSKVIGKVSENKATLLKFHVDDAIVNYGFDFYLDFKKPNGSKFTTQKLNIVNKTVEYEITNSLLDEEGFLQIEVVLSKDNIKIIYPTLWFEINNSINATNELAPENKTLISEIEDVLSKIDTSGNGDKFLSDDGTYRSASGGAIKEIESLDANNPIILRNLESGCYCLHGYILPFDGSDALFAAQTPIQVNIAKSSEISFVQLFFAFNNQLQYFEITDSSYTMKNILFNEIMTRLEALESKVS